MSYETHNFTSGQKLSAADMAQIDEQISQNESDIATLIDQFNNFNAQVDSKIRQLNIVPDSDRIHLYYGDEYLDTADLTDTSLIACTGFSVTNTSVSIDVGGTAQITSVKQPTNCNQVVRYKSADPNIATVSSTGLITGIKRGRVNVVAMCGQYTGTVVVDVAEEIALTTAIFTDNWNWCNISTSYGHTGFNAQVNGTNNYFANLPFDTELFAIKPGESVEITTSSTLSIRRGFVFTTENGAALELYDLREDNNSYFIDNAVQVEAFGSSSLKSYTYANTGSSICYVAFLIFDSATDKMTIADAIQNIDIIIKPTPAA